MDKYVCPCGYEYDPAVGDPDNGVSRFIKEQGRHANVPPLS